MELHLFTFISNMISDMGRVRLAAGTVASCSSLKAACCSCFAVRNQPLAAGDSKSAGLCVAPRSFRTKQIPGRGGADLRLLGT